MLDILTDGTRLTDTQKRSGVEAAMAVFRQHGEDPRRCYRVYGYNIRGPLNLARSEERLIDLWEEAESAAISAACAGRSTTDVSLVYLHDEDRPAAAA